MSDVEWVKQFYKNYDAMKGGNRQDFVDICAQDVEFGSLGGPSDGAEFLETSNTKDHVAASLDLLFDGWSMNHYKVTDIVEMDGKFFVRADISFTNKSTSKTLDTKKADFIRFEGGKVVEFFEYFDTAAFRDAMETEGGGWSGSG